MAMRLADTMTIDDFAELGMCPLCGSRDRDPDDMDRWAAHLTTWHGYTIREDRPRSADGNTPRTIELELVGWSTHAKFAPNERANVKANSRPRDYAGRRGTIVGWSAATSEYALTFDQSPLYGVLPSHVLEPYQG